MKKPISLLRINILVVAVFIFFSFTSCSSLQFQNNENVTGQDKYNLEELNNYGEWININKYGSVWRPFVVNDWMPFNNGHWSFADGNWTWISYEPFGWIVYHYGNWYDDPYYGWVWLPSDDSWSPARVLWMDYDDYIGWAPMPLSGIAYGNPWESNENRHWFVVRHKDFTKDNIRDYRINNPVRNETEAGNIINTPPNKSEMEKYAGNPVNEFKMQKETIKLPEREIKKMNLPPQENKRVEENSPRVRKEVLVSREEYHKKHKEGNQEQNEEKRKK